MSSNLGQIGPQTTELSALERLKYPHRLIMGKMMSPLFAVVFDLILLIIARNVNMHESLDKFEFQPHLTTDYIVSCP